MVQLVKSLHFCWSSFLSLAVSDLYIGFEDSYRGAVSALRGVRREEQRREEQRSLFNFKRKEPSSSSSSSCWVHKFSCLESTVADRVPTSQSAKMVLEEAGLGEKVVTIPDIDCTPDTFHKLLLTAYPKLREGGGFELMRCLPQSRDMC